MQIEDPSLLMGRLKVFCKRFVMLKAEGKQPQNITFCFLISHLGPKHFYYVWQGEYFKAWELLMYEPRVYIFSYTRTTFLFWGQIEAFLPRWGVLCGLLGSSGDIFQYIFFCLEILLDHEREYVLVLGDCWEG